MPNCEKCNKMVQHRNRLKNDFRRYTKRQIKIRIGREWKRLAEQEALLCQGCSRKAGKVISGEFTIPAIRQWPKSDSCSWCQSSMKAIGNLNLHSFGKGREGLLLALCNKCISDCNSSARSCLGARATRDLLQKRAIQAMPNAPNRPL
jgi:hypothetical protein